MCRGHVLLQSREGRDQDVGRTVLPLRVVIDEVPMALATGLTCVAACAPVLEFVVVVDLDAAAFFTITVLLTFGAALVDTGLVVFFVDTVFSDDLAVFFVAATVDCLDLAAVRALDALFGTDFDKVVAFDAEDLPAAAVFRPRLAAGLVAGSSAFVAGCAALVGAFLFDEGETTVAFAASRAASTAFSFAAISFSRFSKLVSRFSMYFSSLTNSFSSLANSLSRLPMPSWLFFASAWSDASLLATAFSFSAASFSRFLPSSFNSLTCFSKAETCFSAANSAYSTSRV